MSLAANALQRTSRTPAPNLGSVSRARVARDFVLLITLCLSIGLGVGLAMMAAVAAMF